MNLDSKSPQKKLRRSLARFQQKYFCRTYVTAALCRCSFFAFFAFFVSRQFAKLLFLPFRRSLRRFRRRFVRRLGFRHLTFMLALHLHQRVMRLLRTFAAFLLFALRLFLLRWLLDSRKLPQRFFSLFGRLSSSRQLQREHLLDHRIKLRSFRHSNSFQFVANGGNSSPQRPPFIQVRLDLRERAGISRFRQQVAGPVRRHLFHELEGVNRSIQFLAGQFLAGRFGLLAEAQNLFRLGGAEPQFPQQVRLLAIFQPSQNRQQHRSRQPRPQTRHHQVVPHLAQLVDRFIVRFFLRQQRVHHLQQFVLFPRLQRAGRLFFLCQRAQLLARVFRRDAVMQIALHRQFQPLLRALLQLKAHPRRVSQHPQQSRRLVGEAVNRQRANLAAFNIRKPVRWVQQQSARSRIQRNGNRVQRKIAPPQILHDGGPTNIRPGSRPYIMVIARRGNASLAFARKQ